MKLLALVVSLLLYTVCIAQVSSKQKFIIKGNTSAVKLPVKMVKLTYALSAVS
jgi:hypothetical protein